jgi:hypothetical protein
MYNNFNDNSNNDNKDNMTQAQKNLNKEIKAIEKRCNVKAIKLRANKRTILQLKKKGIESEILLDKRLVDNILFIEADEIEKMIPVLFI